jgi:hypothetical protein
MAWLIFSRRKAGIDVPEFLGFLDDDLRVIDQEF